jgi:Ca2+-binding RTX toxin-like protein
MPQMRNRFRLSWVVTCTIVLALIPASAAHAAVATSCSFDAPTATVTGIVGTDATTTLGRSGTAITFDGAPCGAADVTNTDQINITSPDLTAAGLTIDMSSGPFAPGKTAEADGSDEIEIALDLGSYDALTIDGGPGPDTIDASRYAVDLLPGAAGENEVTIAEGSIGPVTVNGGAGDDDIRVSGEAGGATGGDGDDVISGDIKASATYEGGAGDDTLTSASGPIRVTVNAPGDAAVGSNVNGTATAEGFETYRGTDAADVFIGSPDGDHFVGGGGNDIFLPQGGDDIVEGGEGYDAITFTESSASVHVDLTNGQADGEGADTFTSVEVVQGTNEDDRFVGDPREGGIVSIDGSAGHDVLDMRSASRGQDVALIAGFPDTFPWTVFTAGSIRVIRGSEFKDRISVGASDIVAVQRARIYGEGGNDTLIGGPHHDVLEGGPGDDHLDGEGGRDICGGGSGSDTIVNCEVTG